MTKNERLEERQMEAQTESKRAIIKRAIIQSRKLTDIRTASERRRERNIYLERNIERDRERDG